MVPPPLTEEAYWQRKRAARRLTWWVRGALVGMALIPAVVFAVALYLDPYRDGKVWLEETHRQLGFPACSFRVLTGLPCPSCGMTSSFALFVRGDLLHSLEANWAGTYLAGVSLLFILWSLVSALRGKLFLMCSWEGPLVRLVLSFVVVMFLRWGWVLLMRLW